LHIAPTHVRRGPDLHRHPLTWLFVLALLVAIALLVEHDVFQKSDSPALTKGSGVAATATRQVGPFSGIELAGGNNVVIRVGAKQSVTVHGDANLLRLVTTDVRGKRLVIGTRDSFITAAPMSVAVSVPVLDAISLSGSGRLTISGIDAELLTVTLDGSGAVFARGHADRVDASLTGSGNLELQRVVTRDAHAVVSGSGQIWLYATRSVRASLPGTGAILYSGDPPQVTKDVSGTGAVVAK
jgi:hypothetical protein